jgi:hypothetical protein
MIATGVVAGMEVGLGVLALPAFPSRSTRSFGLAILAGMAITLLTRMHNGTESMPAKLVASISIAFLLAGLRLFHSILDSLVIFFALQAGRAPFGYEQWARFFGIAAAGNVVGGMGFTTLFRLIRSRQRLVEHRVAALADAEGDVDGAHAEGDVDGAHAEGEVAHTEAEVDLLGR